MHWILLSGKVLHIDFNELVFVMVFPLPGEYGAAEKALGSPRSPAEIATSRHGPGRNNSFNMARACMDKDDLDRSFPRDVLTPLSRLTHNPLHCSQWTGTVPQQPKAA